MAIIKLGTVVVGIRGTAGGITFSANKAGPYMKPWQRPPRVRSAAQAAAGNIMTAVSSTWRDVSQSDRDDWDTWAAGSAPARYNSLGELIELSGFNWYVEMNTQLVINGDSIIETAPTLSEPAAPTIDDWTVNETGGGNADVDYPAGTFTSYYRYFRVAMATSIGRSSFAQANYYVINKPMGAGSSNNLGPNLDSLFGGRQLGRRWFLEMARINAEGLIGPVAQAVTDTI